MARPKSRQAHDAVLDAALTLFADRGIDATSMDAIAATSGVSKATIYKHWPDKDALALEVLAAAHGRDAAPPEADSGDLRKDLLAVLGHEPPAEFADRRRRMMPHLMAHAARQPEFGRAWRATALAPPRRHLARVLERAIARRELPRHLDLDTALALLLGPVMYNHVWKDVGTAPPAGMHEAVVEVFLEYYRVRPTPSAAPSSGASGRPAARAASTRRGRRR